jgi:hypothetical protein
MIKAHLCMNLISRLKDLVICLIGIVVGAPFLNSRLKHGKSYILWSHRMHKLEWYLGMVIRHWMVCYHTQPGNSVPSKMWSMHQRLSRLNKFLGQGLGSAQPISRWFSQWKLVHRSRFPMGLLQYGYLLSEICSSWVPTPP